MVQSQWHPENRNAGIVKSQLKDDWINKKIKPKKKSIIKNFFTKNNNFHKLELNNFNIKVTRWKIYKYKLNNLGT